MTARACWKIAETDDGLSVVYVNLVDSLEHVCGVVRRDTPPALLLEWIADEGDPGDIVLWNGEPTNYLLERAHA